MRDKNESVGCESRSICWNNKNTNNNKKGMKMKKTRKKKNN